MAFFTERLGDLPARNSDAVTADFLDAVAAFLRGLCDRNWLARGWPLKCQDEQATIVATDQDAFWNEAFSTLNLSARNPARLRDEPVPLRVLNLLEFAGRHVAYPHQHGFHDYFGHVHLQFDGPKGKAEYRDEVNDLFARFGLAFEMAGDGVIVRIPPEEIRATLTTAVFQTGDKDLDELLETARTKYMNPDPGLRKEGLEKLWDAFERLKTIAVGKDKKAQTTALIGSAYPDADARIRFDTEFRELTDIGNTYNIRHFETSKLPIPDDAFVDWLFPRCYSAIHTILEKTAKVRH